jgi:LmbE family N-acetylglucosaminyl deacetylase
MIRINFSSVQRIMCLGAHSDDIEFGCGGTMLKLIREHPDIEIYWIVFSGPKQRRMEAERSAEMFLDNAVKKQVIVKEFRDGFFPYTGSEIKQYFEELKQTFDPDLIFTHYRHDLHQDHRLISELTWNTYRDHFILEYEIPKYDADLGHPNFFVCLGEITCRKKVEFLYRAFESQKDKSWFDENTFWAILKLRGIESNAPEKYAEAFHCRKIVL